MTVPGGEVGTGGITAVAVRPDHRRRGILRKMLDWLLERPQCAKRPSRSSLTASEAAISGRFGFGPGIDRDGVLGRSGPPSIPRADPDAGGRRHPARIPEATSAFARVDDQVVAGIPGAVSAASRNGGCSSW